jgi:hypothetical protein
MVLSRFNEFFVSYTVSLLKDNIPLSKNGLAYLDSPDFPYWIGSRGCIFSHV